jgi:HSP20 family protein
MDLFVYDRLANGGSLLDRVNGLFNGPPSELLGSSPAVDVAVDVVEDHDGYRFSFELPGLKIDSLVVKVEDESLVIDAERNQPAWAKDAQVHRSERQYGRIHRHFKLPGDVGHDAIKAAYKDGVLEVTLAKRPEAKAVRIEVAYNN